MMDIFCDSHDVESRFPHYIEDLRRLLVFHGVVCGEPSGLVALGIKLEESKALRLDLPALLRAIHEFDGERITVEQMLTMLALASGGADVVDGRAETVGLLRIVALLRVMIAGVGLWSEPGGGHAPTEPREQNARPLHRHAVLPAASPTHPGAPSPALTDPGASAAVIEELRRQLREMDDRLHRLEPAAGDAAPGPPLIAPSPASAPALPIKQPTPPIVEAIPPNGKAAPPIHDEAQPQISPATPPSVTHNDRSSEPAVLTSAGDGSAAGSAASVPPWSTHAALPAWRPALAGALTHPRYRHRLVGVAAMLLFVVLYGLLYSTRSRHAKTQVVQAAATTPAVLPPSATESLASRNQIAPAMTTPASQPTDARSSTRNAPPQSARMDQAAGVPAPAPQAADAADEPEETSSSAAPIPVGAATMERRLLSARKPVLPTAAQAKGVSGTVVLNTYISRDGSVSRMDVLSGPPALVDAAMAAVSWRHYRPYLRDGRPVAVVTPVTITYPAR